MKYSLIFAALLVLGHAHAGGQLEVETHKWLNSAQSDQVDNTHLVGNIDYYRSRSKWEKKVDLGGVFYQENSQVTPLITEAYVSRKFRNDTLTFGKKKLNWSKSDEWGLSHFQPKKNINFLNNESEGLFAFSSTHKLPRSVQLEFIASPVNIP